MTKSQGNWVKGGKQVTSLTTGDGLPTRWAGRQTHHWEQGTVMALMTGEVETRIVIAKVGVEIL